MGVPWGMSREGYARVESILPGGVNKVENVTRLVNSLLSTLFRPDKETVWQAEPPEELRGEPINWGDLCCAEVVETTDGRFLVTIEEASPDATKLTGWVQAWLVAWGWDAEVRAEW